MVIVSLLIIFAAALVAASFGLPWLNKRLAIDRLSWLLALAPLVAFILLASRVPQANAGTVYTWEWPWLPTLNLSLGFYVDDLSLFFGLIITFIGILVTVYAGQYFKGDQEAWRFLTYLLLFMVSMLGIVMAGDVLTLFIFWEGTSILSYLLVAYKTSSESARYGALRALLITGGGGIALFVGVLFISSVAGGTDFATILNSGDALRSSDFYLVILLLITLGAFTKSAQFPFHFWLPGAMSAPTPASAYLHSATMVKAGIYLLARLNPVLGFTESWFWLLTIGGGITMVLGAYLGLKQNDQKALLAYSTISQLGVLVMLIGQDISIAYKALVVGILAHALYKSALFLMAGIVDHETGTRDMRRLGGLARVMPFTFAAGLLAALSMAGLPPMFGFLAKETLLATAVHPTLPPFVAQLIRFGAVFAGAFMLAQAAFLIWETFLGKPKDPTIHGHEAPRPMWLAPVIPAALSIILSILPGPKEEAELLSGAAEAAFGEAVKVSFVLFHGLTVELALSMGAISIGLLLFIFRHRVRDWQNRLGGSEKAPLRNLSMNVLYRETLSAIDGTAAWATRLQQGKLRVYLLTMMTATILLVFGLAFTQGLPSPAYLLALDLSTVASLPLLRLLSLLVITGAAAATVFLKRDFAAIMALGALGLAVALLYILEPAPDVALVQIVVDILAVVIMILALIRLPRSQRRKAQGLAGDIRRKPSLLIWNAIVAAGLGLLVTGLTLIALSNRPRESLVSPYFIENAKLATGATDIVGAIVVDYRALDTLLEIVVFSLAGVGIYTLLYQAARKHGDRTRAEDVETRPHFVTRGIGGARASAFVRTTAAAFMPLSLMLAATHIMYGHDQPGDGFTAGVIISLAVGLWYIVFGYEETRQRLPWLKASNFIGTGILLALLTGLTAALVTGNILGNVDFTAGWAFLPRGFHLSTSFLIEVAICLTVLGGATKMLNTLGHPGEVER